MADTPADTANTPPEEKKSFIQKLGAAIPVALTALATTLAGMSTGALSQSMYWRSTAAQDQAKVNDQWAFAQAKRIRAQVCFDAKRVQEAIAGFVKAKAPKKTDDPPEVSAAGKWLGRTKEKPEPPPVADEAVTAVLNALHEREPDAEVLHLARKVKMLELEKIINDATAKALAVENAWKPEKDAATKETADLLTELGKVTDDAARGKVAAKAAAARAVEDDVDDRRYRAESTMNFWVGYLYEVRVKASTATSDSHLKRSQNFFIAMLVAQIGSVLASLAMNRKSGGLSVAALAFGLAAIGFGAYVFLTM